ncbi:MAG: oxygenase MpaB family protein [Actinomycetales bacterium]
MRQSRAEVEGLFGPESVTWRVHSDPAMVVAGFRALLLQATHPLVMAGFAANSDYRADPWGRLQRTGEWVATVTFGPRREAEAAGARLRALHARLRAGVEPETGLPYRVDDPELLLWVHCAEVDSFLTTYLRSGGRLAAGQADQYVAEMRESARLVGLDPAQVPGSVAELEAYVEGMRPRLHVTAEAAEGAIWGFVPPMPLWVRVLTPARPAWAGLVGVAAGLLPRWARRLYGLPGLPTTDLAATAAARGVRRTFLAVPGRLGRNPAQAEALARLSAYDAERRSSGRSVALL